MANIYTITGEVFIAEKIPVHDKFPEYEGSYEVTPTIEGEVLPTKDKSMTDDMTIRPIPYEEVDNPSGGITATIGGY